MDKDIRNIDIVIYKLELALIKANNNKLEVIRKKRQKKEEIIEK